MQFLFLLVAIVAAGTVPFVAHFCVPKGWGGLSRSPAEYRADAAKVLSWRRPNEDEDSEHYAWSWPAGQEMCTSHKKGGRPKHR